MHAAVAVDVMLADDDENCTTFRTQATTQKCLNFTSTVASIRSSRSS